jgi:PPP family 3-phenylpropionic acid transporter
MLGPGHALRVYYFSAFGAMGVLLPYLPTWLDALGFHGFRMGLVVALRPVAMIVSPLLFGLLADRLGLRGSLLRWACFGAIVATSLLTLLGALEMLNFAAVFGLLLVFSVLRAPLTSVADATTLESPHHYGPVRLWGSLGFLVAALWAGHCFDLGSSTSFPLAITLALVLAWAATFLLPARRVEPPRPILAEARRLIRRYDFVALLLVVAGWAFSHSAYDLCISLHLADLGAEHGTIGVAWAIATLAEVALMARSGHWLARWRSGALLLIGLCGASLRWSAIALCSTLDSVLALQPLHALSFGLVWIALMDQIRKRAEPLILATAQGLVMASMAVGGSAGMMVWGTLYDRASARAVFVAASIVTAAVVSGALVLRRARFHPTVTESRPPAGGGTAPRN